MADLSRSEASDDDTAEADAQEREVRKLRSSKRPTGESCYSLFYSMCDCLELTPFYLLVRQVKLPSRVQRKESNRNMLNRTKAFLSWSRGLRLL